MRRVSLCLVFPFLLACGLVARVMPSPRVQDAPVSVKTLATWRRNAMDAAGLSHLRQAGFHCLRRKFASELKDVPLKDLMALGGWKDPKTVIQCYQQA